MVYTDGQALVADTIEELHKFAQRCGVFTFADHRRRPHYVFARTSLPTVMAHGAKRIKTSELVKKANAMAKLRELWYMKATDEEIMERIRKYAPFQPHEMIYYEGQEFTQEEMFEIMFNMYKDMREGKDVSGYKLPKVLPLSPRKDPPSTREKMANLYNLIQQGKQIQTEEEAKETPDKDRLEKIKARVEELSNEYDDLHIVSLTEAAEALSKKAHKLAEERQNLTTLEEVARKDEEISNVKARLEELKAETAALKEKMEAKIRESLDELNDILSPTPPAE